MQRPPVPATVTTCRVSTVTRASSLASTWTGEKHKYGEPVNVYVCVSPEGGGTVEVSPVPTGVTVTPTRAAMSPSGSGVVPFTVVVQRGASGRLTMRQMVGPSTKPHATMPGPTIVTEQDGWHFAPSH